MKRRRFKPPLQKKFLACVEGYAVYSIDPFAIRNAAEADEEFGNFAISEDFPDLIPKDQIWVGSTTPRKERPFFIADAVARLKAMKNGASEASAHTIGLNAERKLRLAGTGVEYRNGRKHKRIPSALYHERYTVLPDPKQPTEVWRIDGTLARSYYKTDYTEGGHGYVYRWVPRGEIWIEKVLERDEIPYIVAHEYIESRLMRDKDIVYDRAHSICARMEFDLRKRQSRKKFPGLTGRRLTRADLPTLAREDFFEYVLGHYERNLVSRIGKLVSDAVSLLP